MKNQGFTLIELLIVIALMVALFSVSFPIFSNMHMRVQQSESVAQIISSLRLAREYSVAGYMNDGYGVYFDGSSFILYKGASYLSRDVNFDRKKEVGALFDVTTSFPDNDINFSGTLSGLNPGTISVKNTNNSNTDIININSLGIVY